MKKNIPFTCSLFLILLCISTHDCQAYSNPTDYFRSKVSGNWNDASSWQSSSDNSIWSNADLVPTISAASITVSAGHIIDIITGVTLDKTFIDGTCRLRNDGNTTSVNGVITLNDGGISDELTIHSGGIFQCIVTTNTGNNYSTFIYGTSGNINVMQGGKIMIGDGTDSHKANGYSGFASEGSSKIKWNNEAIFEWNTTALNFGLGITYFPNASITEKPVFRLSNSLVPTTGSTTNLTINGVFEVNMTYTLPGNSDKIFRNGIRGTGTLTQAGSTSRFLIGPDAILDGPSLHLNLLSPLTLSLSTTIPVGANVTIFGGNINNPGTFKIDGILDATDVSFSPSSLVIINGILKTRNINGIKGSNSTFLSSTFLINDGSTIEYYADADQVINTAPTYYNITFKGGKKIFSSASSIDVHTLGTVSIEGPDVLIDASSNNLGLTIPNTTQFKMNGGKLILGTTGTQPNMGGAYNITGGLIQFTNSNTTDQTVRSPRQYEKLEIIGSNVNNSLGHILLNTGGIFTVKQGGIFTMNDNSIKAANATTGQKIIVENGGLFRTGNSGGFNGLDGAGNIHSAIHKNIDPANIILYAGSTVEYIRASAQPITNADNIIYKNLVLSGSGTKTAPSNELTIQGDFTKANGTPFLHGNGTVIFNGNTFQKILSGAPQLTFHNLTNNNLVGLNVNANMSVYKELKLEANSRMNVNQTLTLISGIANTARLAKIPMSATISYGASGLFIIERYIPNHAKSWQLLSVTAKGKTIKECWQEGAAIPNANPKPGYGTAITSNNNVSWQLNGFDAYSAGGPSMKYYDALNKSYIGIISTKDPIADQLTYFLFVRGDRSVTDYNAPSKATVLRTIGKIYAPGPEAPTTINIPPNSFACIGNPYASSVDFENLTVSGISNFYTIWDPQLTTLGTSVYGYGAFRTISGNVSVPSSGNYVDNLIPPIQSGQAFFVQTNTLPGTILFTEDCKVTGSNSVFKNAIILTEPEAQIRSNLYVHWHDSLILIDGTLTQFQSDPSMLVDEWDARKTANPNENISIQSQSRSLIIERRGLPSVTDTLFYQLTQMVKRKYMLELILTKWENSKLDAFLEDSYLRTQTLLKINSSNRYNFSVNGDLGSQENKRFRIIFKTSGGPLPIFLTKWDAYSKNSEILLEWQLENEINVRTYFIESSTDNMHFTTVAKTKPQNAAIYNWLDIQPAPGPHFYRLGIVELNGETTYSKIVKVIIESKNPGFQIMPNPIINNEINLQFKNQITGKYNIRIFNLAGQVLLSNQFIIGADNNNYKIKMNPRTGNIFMVEIIKPNGAVEYLKAQL